MAVDHGLGGRENVKSKTRRERKSSQLKLLGKKLATKGLSSSRDIKFDEDARVAFVAGFHKRKQERRKFGLTMQILKEKKLRKEALKSRNKMLLELNKFDKSKDTSDIMKADSEEDEENDDDDDEEEENEEKEEGDNTHNFDDEQTRNMFGSSVSVVVSDVIGQNNSDDEEESDSDDDEKYASLKNSELNKLAGKKVKKQKEISRFDRAMKQVKQTMGNRKKKSNINSNRRLSKEQKTKITSKKLLGDFLSSKGLNTKHKKKSK